LRGFRGLQGVDEDQYYVEIVEFQSPCGVLGVCRETLFGLVEKASHRFQSPCGVLGVCRMRTGVRYWQQRYRGFSPLAGF